MRLASGLCCLAFVLGSWSLASAQEAEPPVDGSIEINYFDPAIGPHSFLTVSGAETDPNGKFAAAFLVNFMTHPFTVYNVASDELRSTRTEVVKNYFSGTLFGSYGFGDKYQINAALPIVFSMEGDGVEPTTAMPAGDPLKVSGLGDMKLEAVWKMWQQDQTIISVIPAVTLPTSTGSGENAWLGDDLPSFRPRGAFEWSDPDNIITAGANLGLILRKPRTVYSSEIGQQLTYGVGAAAHATKRVDIVAEMFGRKGFSSDLDESPLEFDGGLRVQATSFLSVLAGGGTGLVQGIGSPGLRVFAALTWSPDYRDSDGDGVDNMKDRCPAAAEDKDGFKDEDGCPEEDNDEDFVPDTEDKCPAVAEDRDTFEDDDGCPEDDNDKDGFKDEIDKCPNHPEDKVPPKVDDGCPASMRDSDDDGIKDDKDKCIDDQEDFDKFQDDDGCPEIDNDGDNVPDEYDQCPASAEDLDGYMDDDGCGEPDNDADGYLDTEDKCPNEKEVVNSFQDEDGCPDQGGEVLARIEEDKVIFLKPLVWKRGEPKAHTTKALDQAYLLMRAEAGVIKWRIVIAAEKQQKEADQRNLSQARADFAMSYIKKKKRVPFALESVGAVSDTPTAIIVAIERGTPEQLAEMMKNQPPPPADRDGDGVFDNIDNCPDEAGKADFEGCAKKQLVVITAEQIEIKQQVFFDTAKATIKKKSFKLLDNLAAVIVAHPELPHLEVGGHTDNKGDPNTNMALSQSRAESVVAYLVGKGVPADKLTPMGYGDTKPIDDNGTTKGRAKNRRVEFRIVQGGAAPAPAPAPAAAPGAAPAPAPKAPAPAPKTPAPAPKAPAPPAPPPKK